MTATGRVRSVLAAAMLVLSATAVAGTTPAAAVSRHDSDAATRARSATSLPAGQPYLNPLQQLDYGCGGRDPSLVRAPHHTFYAYFADGPSLTKKPPAQHPESKDLQACRGAQTTYWVYRSTDGAHWPSRVAGPGDGVAPTKGQWPRRVLTLSQLRAAHLGKDFRATSLWGAGGYYLNGVYYLFYTVNTNYPAHTTGRTTVGQTKSIGLATSRYPDHGFRDHGLLIRGNAANRYYAAHPFFDPHSHHLYVYFSDFLKRLYVKQFATSQQKFVGRAKIVLGSGLATGTSTHCNASDSKGHQSWEHCVIEHSEVFYAGGAPSCSRYYLLYNGAGGASARYSVGYAYSSSPTGTFRRAGTPNPNCAAGAGHNPLLSQHPGLTRTVPGDPVCGRTKIGFYGPGAPNVFHDDAGDAWLMYRFKTTSGDTWGCRGIGLTRLYVDKRTGVLTMHPTLGRTAHGPRWYSR